MHTLLLHLTNGRIGGKLGKQSILLLETIGRKSGQPRLIPIAHFFSEDRYLIVESNWGRDKHADWYLNLKKTPRAVLQANGRKIAVEAHDVTHKGRNIAAYGNLPLIAIRLIWDIRR